MPFNWCSLYHISVLNIFCSLDSLDFGISQFLVPHPSSDRLRGSLRSGDMPIVSTVARGSAFDRLAARSASAPYHLVSGRWWAQRAAHRSQRSLVPLRKRQNLITSQHQKQAQRKFQTLELRSDLFYNVQTVASCQSNTKVWPGTGAVASGAPCSRRSLRIASTFSGSPWTANACLTFLPTLSNQSINPSRSA